MMGLRDNFTLSFTKLRVRRVRLAVTLIVSGIIFTVLVFSSLIASGVTHSLSSFTKEGLLNHYLTMITVDPTGPQGALSDAAVVARAKVLDKARIDAETKEAKRLGVPFDPKTAPSAIVGQGGTSAGASAGVNYSGPAPASSGTPVTVDVSNPAGRQAVIDVRHAFTPADALAVAKPFHPTAAYESFFVDSGSSYGGAMSLTPILNGQEQTQKPTNGFTTSDSIAAFQTELNTFSPEMMKPFMLPGTSLAAKPGEPIPVLAPIDAVEKLVGVTALPKNATPEQQVARIGELRSKAKNLVFQVCFRNSAAVALQAQATQQAADITAHKSDPDYQKPTLIYGQPAGPCQATPVASDTRSADEKAQASKQQQFDQEFGAVAPATSIVKFKIVGIEPQPPSFSSAVSISGIITSFFTSTLGLGWIVPMNVAEKDPVLGPIVNDPLLLALNSRLQYVDFASRADQKAFMDAKSCTPQGGIFTAPSCPAGKYLLNPFGNPLAVVQDAGAGFTKSELISLSVIALLAAIVMMGTIGKIIADSRKETSVFRALGAKRLDIAQIYLLYTVFLASLGFGVAVILGAAGPIYLQLHYGPSVSAQAVLAFNSQDLHKQVHLLGFNPLDFAEIYAYVVGVALIAAIIPLLNGIKRNPVKDMREE
jgi:hypothetical protein